MISKKMYVAIAMHDGVSVVKSSHVEVIAETHRMVMDLSLDAATQRAIEHCYRATHGSGTYAMVFECVAVIEPPPMVAPVIKHWNENNELTKSE